MKMTNEELVYSARDSIESIELAMSEIEDIEEYGDVLEILDEAIDRLKEAKEIYEEEYDKELQEEIDYQNREYERSKI